MTTTTQLNGYGTYTQREASVGDTVRDFVGEFAAEFNLDGLADAYRDAINVELNGTGIILRGDVFYANHPAPEDSTELIKDAIEAIDLGAIAEAFDQAG